MSKKKTALFGGTFDPVHSGHIVVAAEAAGHIGAEKIIFIPAKHSPLKTLPPVACDEDRLAMLELAIAGNDKFELSDCEIKKTKPSYTLDTVREFQIKYGDEVAICWLTGADSIDELSLWYKITELIDECEICVMYRAGCERPSFEKFAQHWGKTRIEKMQKNIIETSLVNISSTEIRRRLAEGRDVSGMLDEKVNDYIYKRGLYVS